VERAAEFVKIWINLTKEWTARMEEELAPQLTLGQLEVLELLQAHEPMKPSDMLPHLKTTPAAVTTLLDRMERAGLVERRRDEQDRRIVWIHMTDLGRAEVVRGLKVRTEIVHRSLERISAHNQRLLMYLLAKVAGVYEKPAAGQENTADGDSQAAREGQMAQDAEAVPNEAQAALPAPESEATQDSHAGTQGAAAQDQPLNEAAEAGQERKEAPEGRNAESGQEKLAQAETAVSAATDS